MAPSFLRDVPRLEGSRVTVMGLGLFGGGLGLTRFLVRSGARVTVTDLRTEDELSASVGELKGFPVEFRLGGHDARDFRGADLVVVNPGVPAESPYLKAARALETEMNLFLKLCRARRIVGITGSNGKSTTTTLAGEILKRAGEKTWVGGNLGGSLLESVEEIAPDDVVVLELSSFQLEALAPLRRSPHVAVVLNIFPNHLDRHGTLENYIAAKREIVAHQAEDDWKILNADDPRVCAFGDASPSRSVPFSLRGRVPGGVTIEGASLTHERFTLDVSRRRMPGTFNLQNMAAAAAMTFVTVQKTRQEAWRKACEEVFNAFPGVEHRLEFVAEKGGITYINDSKATDADATMAALSAMPGPFVLILGGSDKGVSFDVLARAVSERPVRAVALMGQTAGAIEAALRAQPRVPELFRVASLEEAVRVPARPGETLLFSPACASFDMFRNYVERGETFKKAVAAL